jgi:glutathione S-transferase
VGRIPVLETDQGPIFETAAIALWLADRHHSLAPAPDSARRAPFLSWLFFLSNTVHSELRTLFYPATIVGPDRAAQSALSLQTQRNLTSHFTLLNTECARQSVIGAETPSICDLYAAALLRWPALYPQSADRNWFDLTHWPALLYLTRSIETRSSATRIAHAEGLGPTPFSNPQPPNPPEGSAV